MVADIGFIWENTDIQEGYAETFTPITRDRATAVPVSNAEISDRKKIKGVSVPLTDSWGSDRWAHLKTEKQLLLFAVRSTLFFVLCVLTSTFNAIVPWFPAVVGSHSFCRW